MTRQSLQKVLGQSKRETNDNDKIKYQRGCDNRLTNQKTIKVVYNLLSYYDIKSKEINIINYKNETESNDICLIIDIKLQNKIVAQIKCIE